jgi:CheY-like chemotaxis protein
MRSLIGIVLFTALLVPAHGQEVPQFYKKPETTAEFWRAMNHEIEVGQFKIAAGYLKGFLARNPSDEELLQIQDREGSSAFVRLLTISELRADAKPLVERVDALVQKHLSEPRRLDTLIKNLNATPEERSYSIAQLRRAGAAAMPALIDAVLHASDSGERAAILSALPKLDRSIVPPLLAALDVDDPNVRSELIGVISERAETAATPDLAYLSASPKQPAAVRDRATRVLASFLGIRANGLPVAQVAAQLPPAKTELTRAAERYYQHRIRFPELGTTTVWRWDGSRKQLVSRALPISQAEEFYGLRFAGWALDLDPGYTPAQIVYLSFLLDQVHDNANTKNVLRSANPELVIAVLKKALTDQRLPVILAATGGLGDQAEARALQAPAGETPALVQALNYPDRRVQLAAANAVLRIPTPPSPPVAARVVEILARAVAGESEAKAQPKVLMAFADEAIANIVANNVQKAGFEPVVAHTGRELLRRLNQAADIDLLLIDAGLRDPGLPFLLAQLRADRNAGHLPLLVTAPGGGEPSLRPLRERYQEERRRMDMGRDLAQRSQQQGLNDLADRYRQETAQREEYVARLNQRYGEESAVIEEKLRHLTERQPNVTVISASQIWDAKNLGRELRARLADPASKPLAGAEAKDNAAKALEWLARLGRGEASGYDLRPAGDAILKALYSKDLANLAVEAAGHLPGRAPQRELANVVLDQARPEGLRSAAAIELCRHIQQYGLGLTREQIRGIETLYATLHDPRLKANVALVLGGMHPDSRRTGERLRSFTPAFSAPAPKQEAPAGEKAAPKER